MPTKNPRPNRTQVRDAIIRTAREIAANEGWSAVTVRKVAQSIGYTAPIIYEHFGSKDEMLNQILKHGYEILYDKMVQVAGDEEDSEKRIREIALAYWQFAHEAPELYQLMYGMEGARATSDAARDYAAPVVKFITAEMVRFNPDRITQQNLPFVLVEAWSMVHGMIALDVSGYTSRYVDSKDLPEVLVTGILQLLRRQ
jgi:AcrR family transcriptional regulator